MGTNRFILFEMPLFRRDFRSNHWKLFDKQLFEYTFQTSSIAVPFINSLSVTYEKV